MIMNSDQHQFTERILAYMRGKEYHISTAPGALNIVYVEGCDPSGRPNADAADRWNDLRIVIAHDGTGTPSMLLCEPATTEPGLVPTRSRSALQRGGVARIAFGQFMSWRIGLHKGNPAHPALVQCAPVTVHRDLNQDGRRTGDRLDIGLFGINQHGTGPKYKGDKVGFWSEGCAVGRVWVRHLYFIGLCKGDARYKANAEHVFATTIIAGDDLARVCPIPAG